MFTLYQDSVTNKDARIAELEKLYNELKSSSMIEKINLEKMILDLKSELNN